MTDEQLRQALRSLPRHRASEGFTDRVLDRLERGAERAGAWHRLRLALALPVRARRWVAVAAATLLAALLPLAVGHEEPPPETDSRRALRELRSELEEIKRLAAEPSDAEPVLYLGGDDRYELVVDLANPLGFGPRGPDDRGAVVTPALNRDQSR